MIISGALRHSDLNAPQKCKLIATIIISLNEVFYKSVLPQKKIFIFLQKPIANLKNVCYNMQGSEA